MVEPIRPSEIGKNVPPHSLDYEIAKVNVFLSSQSLFPATYAGGLHYIREIKQVFETAGWIVQEGVDQRVSPEVPFLVFHKS